MPMPSNSFTKSSAKPFFSSAFCCAFSVSFRLAKIFSDYDLTLYDEYGNQVGKAEWDGEGRKKVSDPNWDVSFRLAKIFTYSRSASLKSLPSARSCSSSSTVRPDSV